jgi:3-deoxy-7-phosphoheptulonate synthase
MRLLESYFRSATTLNYIRAAVDGGFADLHHPGNWDMNAIEKTAKWADYEDVVHRILDAIEFMESFGGIRADELGRIEFYTSHEGLLLGYEDALTRKSPITEKYYNLGAHRLWIGRTYPPVGRRARGILQGIENPIGIRSGLPRRRTICSNS